MIKADVGSMSYRELNSDVKICSGIKIHTSNERLSTTPIMLTMRRALISYLETLAELRTIVRAKLTEM